MMRSFFQLALPGLLTLCMACPGKDYLPVYFAPSAEEGPPPPPAPSEAPTEPHCALQFEAELCVMIKGDNIEAGATGSNGTPLCSIVPPIPLEITGSTVVMRGETFPDIYIDGHGLPVPITIHGRDNGDGRTNIGEGTIGNSGEITIEHFDFTISALDQIGTLPDFTLTTERGPTFEDLPAVSGSRLTSDGHLTLVGGTILGPLFPSADAFLLGAELSAVLQGVITPTLEACGTAPGQPTQFSVTKLMLDNQGREIEVPIPNGNQLEISTGTYISQNATDVGPRFEAEGRFEITNISPAPIALTLPPTMGVFHLESTSALNQRLPADGSMRIRVTFRPVQNLIEGPGVITEELPLGADTFTLRGTALAASGRMAIDLLDQNGEIQLPRIAAAHLGDLFAPASPRRAFFACAVHLCGGAPLPTDCRPCLDVAPPRTAVREGPTFQPHRGVEGEAPAALPLEGATRAPPMVATENCRLLTINDAGDPIDEVDDHCELRYNTAPSSVIHFGSQTAPVEVSSRLFAIRNIGTAPLTITAMRLAEVAQSRSTKQFLFQPSSVVVAASIDALTAAHIQAATVGDDTPQSVTPFPLTLPPHEPPITTTRAFFVVGYLPDDLLGSDGRQAGVGARVTDQATLEIDSENVTETLALKGTMSIKDIPALQVFVKTGTGLKEQSEGTAFAFRDITAQTTDLAVPLFIQLTETASSAVRITGMQLTGPDVAYFEMLDARDEIDAKPETSRCTNPIFGPDGGIIDVQTAPTPVVLGPNGYDLIPGSTTTESMPFFGCINFARADTGASTQRQFEATLILTTQPLGPDKKPIKNRDGSIQQSEFHLPLLAVIAPRQGKAIFRITQTLSMMLNTQFPTVASVPSLKELTLLIAEGKAKPDDRFLFTGAFLLDPFDEETIVNEAGEIISTPNDDITAVFRKVDSRPLPIQYDNPLLRDYVNLSFDAVAPQGMQGQFFDYPNVPEDLQANNLKIFTGSLSYPGPVAPEEERPSQPSACEEVDPCSVEGQQKFGNGPTEPGKTGVCAYFYTSAGRFDSPSLHEADAMSGGARQDLCASRGTPQQLRDMGGTYTLDGHFAFDLGLRFWGPTYFHNPSGPLGAFPPLDEVWHINFTTHTLAPPTSAHEPNLVPDARINVSKQEYKINLTDPTLDTPPICAHNTANLFFQGETYSTWAYLIPLLSKDTEGLIPAGCPEPNNTYAGGSAYLHGRPLDHETGILTVVGVAKFSSRPSLTFVFKDVTMFIVMNGWLCDPTGDPEQWEGEHCYDLETNERDAVSQISVVKD